MLRKRRNHAKPTNVVHTHTNTIGSVYVAKYSVSERCLGGCSICTRKDEHKIKDDFFDENCTLRDGVVCAG